MSTKVGQITSLGAHPEAILALMISEEENSYPIALFPPKYLATTSGLKPDSVGLAIGANAEQEAHPAVFMATTKAPFPPIE